jgi:hypothetical protein
MTQAFYIPKARPLTAGGKVMPGAKLTFYAVGTTTMVDIYTDINATTTAANPAIADSNGEFSAIYIVGSVDVWLTTSADAAVWGPVTVSDGGGAIVASVAALKALNGPTYATTLGYYTAGDGGHGTYRLSTSTATANDGTIITPTSGSGRWELLHNGEVNCKQFGAKGDGTTDNATTLQAWITAAVAEFWTAKFTKGTYQTSVRLTATGPITIIGTGWDCILQLTSAAAVIPLLVQKSDYGAVPGCKFSNFCIDGNAGGQYSAGLLNLNGCTGVLVDHMLIKGGSRTSGVDGVNGIVLAAADPAGVGSTGTVSNCSITASSKAAINVTGSSAAYGERVLIQGNNIYLCTGNGSTPGVQINAGGRVIVDANHIKTTQGAGVLVASGSGDDADIEITKNIIIGCGTNTVVSGDGDGIRVTATTGTITRLRIAGNTCDDNGTSNNGGSGIFVNASTNVQIHDNLCRNNQYDGIRATALTHASIVNNRCTANNVAAVSFGGGIQLLGASSHISVKNNHCSDDSGSTPQSYGLIIGTGSVQTELTVEGNHLFGNKTQGNPFLCQGNIVSGVIKLVGRVQETNTATNILQFFFANGSSASIHSKVTGSITTTGTDAALYTREALFKTAAGATTQVGATTTLGTDLESNAAWTGATMDANSNSCRVRVQGVAATAVDWYADTTLTVVA